MGAETGGVGGGLSQGKLGKRGKLGINSWRCSDTVGWPTTGQSRSLSRIWQRCGVHLGASVETPPMCWDCPMASFFWWSLFHESWFVFSVAFSDPTLQCLFHVLGVQLGRQIDNTQGIRPRKLAVLTLAHWDFPARRPGRFCPKPGFRNRERVELLEECYQSCYHSLPSKVLSASLVKMKLDVTDVTAL